MTISRRDFFKRLSGATALAFVMRYGPEALNDAPLIRADNPQEIARVRRELIQATDEAGGYAPKIWPIDRDRWMRLFDEMIDPDIIVPKYSVDSVPQPHIMVCGVPVVIA